MKHDVFVDGEAMSEIEGNDVTYLVGSVVVVDMQVNPQRRAFQAYKVAFNQNAVDPNLKNAIALVTAWDEFARVMGLDR